MQIDPRTIKQLIEYQLLGSINLQGTALEGTSSQTDSLFSDMLQQLLTDESGGTTASSTASLLQSLAGGGLSSLQSTPWYNMSSMSGDSSLDDVSSMANMSYSTDMSSTSALSSLAHMQGTASAYDDLITAASEKYGVPASLIKAVISTESSFNSSAQSSAGAKGLMQLMDGTAQGLGVTNPFDPEQNIDAGVRYLSVQLKRYSGQVNMALAAYNAGPGKVNALGVSSDAELMARLNELPAETRKYIGKIERALSTYEA